MTAPDGDGPPFTPEPLLPLGTAKKMERDAKAKKAAAGAPDWRSQLILDSRDAPRPLLANAIAALRGAPEWDGLLQFDAFGNRTVLRGAPPWSTTAVDQEWSNVFDLRAADWLQHRGVHVSPDVAAQAVELVASENKFHPVVDYLQKCKWDGEPRLDEWAAKYLGAPATKYVEAVCSKFLISAVARVSVPGCKADCAPIFEGRQGLLKSTMLKALSSPWFADDIADLGSKDAAMQIAGVWILELSELDSMTRVDVARVKSFMSRAVDRYRPPYSKRVIEQRRQVVFCGTSNANDYLRDETGGRRFWPLTCSAIDIDGLTAVRDQLWGEAHARYLSGEGWWLEGAELNAAAGAEQQARYHGDAWSDRVIGFFSADPTRAWITIPEVLQNCLALPVERWGQIEQNRVARILVASGWRRKQRRNPYDKSKLEWGYVRADDPSPLLAPSPDEEKDR